MYNVNARGGEEKMMLTLANLGVGTSATNAASWSDKGVGFGQRGMFMAGGDGSPFVFLGIILFGDLGFGNCASCCPNPLFLEIGG